MTKLESMRYFEGDSKILEFRFEEDFCFISLSWKQGESLRTEHFYLSPQEAADLAEQLKERYGE